MPRPRGPRTCSGSTSIVEGGEGALGRRSSDLTWNQSPAALEARRGGVLGRAPPLGTATPRTRGPGPPGPSCAAPAPGSGGGRPTAAGRPWLGTMQSSRSLVGPIALAPLAQRSRDAVVTVGDVEPGGGQLVDELGGRARRRTAATRFAEPSGPGKSRIGVTVSKRQSPREGLARGCSSATGAGVAAVVAVVPHERLDPAPWTASCPRTRPSDEGAHAHLAHHSPHVEDPVPLLAVRRRAPALPRSYADGVDDRDRRCSRPSGSRDPATRSVRPLAAPPAQRTVEVPRTPRPGGVTRTPPARAGSRAAR